MLSSISPPLATQLRTFAEKSLDEMVPNGLAPDVVGAGNLYTRNTQEDLYLVDTIALHEGQRCFKSNAVCLGEIARSSSTADFRNIFGTRL